MSEGLQSGLVRATEVAGAADVRRATNGLNFASYGETGVPMPDLDRMIEAVPPAITEVLKDNTYFFVPLALREQENNASEDAAQHEAKNPALVAESYTTELDARAICHRNVALGRGQQGVFISTRLMGDRFALCFEFFINVAHAYADAAGVPEAFAALAWAQATGGARGPLAAVRGETSMDAWESRNLALGLPADGAQGHATRKGARAPAGTPMASRAFGDNASAGTVSLQASAETGSAPGAIDEKERGNFLNAAFADALAMYLLSLAVDFDYTELREREYPLLAPAALGARLKAVADLFPPNVGYEFAVRYRKR